jgi:hypothetical protein
MRPWQLYATALRKGSAFFEEPSDMARAIEHQQEDAA